MRSGKSCAALAAFAISVSACDSSNDPAPAPTPTPANRAPSITSAATASAAENVTGTIYTATATDPDNNPLSFSISGGEDRAAFQISAAGALSFVASPDFENPTDADRNNVYRVTIAASDGSLTGSVDLVVTVTNVADALRVRRVATGFTDTVRIRPAHRSDSGRNDAALPPRIYIAQRFGRISLFTAATGESKNFLDLRGRDWSNSASPVPVPDTPFALFPEGGLFDFGVASSGQWTVSYTNQNHQLDVRLGVTFQSSGSFDTAKTTGTTRLLRVDYPAGATHYGGKMAWWYAGGDKLYLGLGDGGDPANARSGSTRLGKLLVHAGDVGTYWETVAVGLRDPASPFYVPDFGMLVPDHGATAMEEIHLFNGSRPVDFGWPNWEGTQRFTSDLTDVQTVPVLQYPHGTGLRAGSKIVGGAIYSGPLAALANRYFFADEVTGNIWSVPVASLVAGSTVNAASFQVHNADFVPDQGAIEHPTAIGTDLDGNLYIADSDGEIFMVVGV